MRFINKLRNNIKDNLMYTDWKIGKAPFPAKLEEIHINDFKNRTEKKFFARKINSTNIELFDKKK
ncbi:MAG: hypothetical protein E6176_03315, partial [Clostridium celatum]|nr:hypothetical protein [Clostridium celatum]